MPLSQVIANDRAYKLKQDSQKEEQRDVSDFVAFLLPFGAKRQNKELSSSNSSLSSTSETPNESTSPNTPEPAPRARRRVSTPITTTIHALWRVWQKKHCVCGLWSISSVMFKQWYSIDWKPALWRQETPHSRGNLLPVLMGKDHMDHANLLQIPKCQRDNSKNLSSLSLTTCLCLIVVN